MAEPKSSGTNRNTAATLEHNARAWDQLARQQAALAQPVRDEDLREPLKTVDPLGWLGNSIAGSDVLCLAAGGGKHSILYAACGARVTVVDISAGMLALDRTVAEVRGYDIRVIQGSMDNLSMFSPASFDVVIHPVSTCYVPDVDPVFCQVATVIRPGGIYVSQHKTPVSLQSDTSLEGSHYRIQQTYYREGPLPANEPCRLREQGTLEFLHRWEQIVGGICRAGFVIEDLIEPMHADAKAEPGSFGHRSQMIAPYVRIKARKTVEQTSTSGIELL